MFANSFLEKCQELKLAGFNPPVEPGSRVARNYADLGFEAYQLVRGGKLVSLFTGKLVERPDDFEKHFFLVPSCDEMVAWLDRHGFDIDSMHYQEQRKWMLTLRCSEDKVEARFEAVSLEEVFLEALLYAFHSPRQSRCTQ